MHTIGGSLSTAILENSMKMVPGVELIGNLSGNACISHAHDYSTVHSSQDVASAWVHPQRKEMWFMDSVEY